MMDMGQITQGLRADILQQAAGQGINVAQMMESGVSFADIMLLILQNTQSIANGQGIPVQQLIPQMDAQVTDVQSEAIVNQNEASFMADMKNIMPNMLNIRNSSDVKTFINDVIDHTDMQNAPDIMDTMNMPTDNQNMSEVNDISDFVGANKASDMPVFNGENAVSDIQNIENNNNDNFFVQGDKNSVSQFVDSESESGNTADFSMIGKNEQLNNTDIYAMTEKFENKNSATILHADKLEKPVIESVWKMASDVQKEVPMPNKIHSPQLHNADNLQNDIQVNSLAQKLSEVIGLISPEIVSTAENSSSMMNNNFVIDLLSELSSEGEIKDSFDMSESMLKIDPMQLAGLLDFISTGNGIPQASDLFDNQMFKNLDNISSVKESSEKIVFNPQEMLKTGEMEIVSYTPAQKNEDNSQHSNQKNNENAIDLARTMKSVKENVKTDVNEDTAKFSEVSASMTASNPDEIAKKVDISFERAYAELEMNKAKYGSADQQLYNGISENLERGRSEFTVKLRPEGLGEILVKLVSDDGGKAILTLVASSEKTAELLNKDLASLQTSLNQHNVEIENNSVKTAETVMHAESAFEQFNERQQDEANQQHHFRQLKERLGDISDRNISFEEETELVANIASNSALNITI